MPQNRYDDPEFFARYSALDRSTGGLDRAGEWPALRALLPALTGARVLDLGCGFGWHCRYARQAGAASVVGVDLSEKMLERARAATDDDGIVYHRAAIEAFDIPEASFDVVLSSLALHYVERLDTVCARVFAGLVPGGAFVLSVEHPVFTANAAQDWCYGDGGERLHWPVDRYHEPGIRRTNWLAEGVVKYHRTLAGNVDALLDAGFHLQRIVEPAPSEEACARNPEQRDERRRPIFLLIAAQKPTAPL